MLGYKRILPINVFLVFCAILFAVTFTPWWAAICRDALPGHPETGFFYHMLVCCLIFWNLGKWTCRQHHRNRVRYHEQYELEVNNFFFQFAPLMAEKLERYNRHQELNQLLKQSIARLNQALEAVAKERDHAV